MKVTLRTSGQLRPLDRQEKALSKEELLSILAKKLACPVERLTFLFDNNKPQDILWDGLVIPDHRVN